MVLQEQIGGFFMATLVSKPGAIEFLTFVTNEKNTIDIAFEEIRYEDLPPACRNKSLGELNIGPSTGTNIIGFMNIDGNFVVNPTSTEILVAGTGLITLGTREQLDKVGEYLESFRE